MSEPSWNRTASCSGNGFLSCARLLVGGTVTFCLALLPLAYWLQGLEGFVAAAAAAAVCLLSGLAALAVSQLPISRRQPLVGISAGMALRMLLPLTVCLLLALQGTQSEHLSFVGYLILFYFLTLAAETFLSLQMIGNSTR